MKITETELKGCFIIEPSVFEDERGCFYEAFNKKKLEEALGYQVNFVQDNVSVSKYGVVRGLHYQEAPFAQAKLVSVSKGRVQDVVVDLRKENSTYLKHVSIELSDVNRKMLFVPKGMAHGFAVLSDEAEFRYKVDEYYNKESEKGLFFNDSKLQIDWPIDDNDIILSEKDMQLTELTKEI
ncbi:dTDP-4-dehydrorhamnose 3,5-epimerase [Flavobacterium sp. ASW18X]|uniref:dTDP-4-dehydrorhamnose 3,5-epimerase n=1 Tax=Flavobacterium sp. ASW18X TaxID=2572595 RepID=UPI0010ADCB25|nr:dTDP-4-dehydrorhamnose 3,5-epimerase [Flavobacterium sp. ASW18X]TKD65103.1 dTDP-4-dehydrorhamnose 3,5-epimerase [Flavobacterium sp. ASW18X]